MIPIAFYTPDYNAQSDCFGCASYGIASNDAENGNVIKKFEIEPEAIEISGTYEQCLVQAEKHTLDSRIKAAIVLLGNAGNENEFIHRLSSFLKCPIVGGSAAMNFATNTKGLISSGGEANLLLVIDEQFDIEVSFRNIHMHVLSNHNLEIDNSRTLLKIDGCDAVEWLSDMKHIYGFSETDFEHMTFSDENNVNAHLRMENGLIVSGRDLAKNMKLRYVNQNEVYESVHSFCDDHNAIVFGCAGLRGIIDREIVTDTLVLFLFGEVCFTNNHAEFGNLMLSKIKFIKRDISD